MHANHADPKRLPAKMDGSRCPPTQPLTIQVYSNGPNRGRDISQAAMLRQDFACIRQSLHCPTPSLEWSKQSVFTWPMACYTIYYVVLAPFDTGKGVAQNPLRPRELFPCLVCPNRKRQSPRVTKGSYWLLTFRFHGITGSPDIGRHLEGELKRHCIDRPLIKISKKQKVLL